MVGSNPDLSTSHSSLVPLEHYRLFERQMAQANINIMTESPPYISREGFEQILPMITGRDITPAITKALNWAEGVHANQCRRDGSSYYPRHVLPVALLYSSVEVSQGRSPSDVGIITAILHDIFEDGEEITMDAIGSTFGEEVKKGVGLLSKPEKKYKERSIDRHRRYVTQLEEGIDWEDQTLLNIKCVDNFLNMLDDLTLMKNPLVSPLQAQNRAIQVNKYHEKSGMYDVVLRYADECFYSLWKNIHIQIDYRLQEYWATRVSFLEAPA